MRRCLFVILVLTMGSTFPARAGVTDISDAVIAYALDDAEATAATAFFIANHPEDACILKGRANGTAAGYGPDGDPIYGHDVAVGSATCPAMPHLIRLVVSIEWFGDGVWYSTDESAECGDLNPAVPTTLPPCVLNQDIFPGPFEDRFQQPWLDKCRRAKLDLIEPAIGQPSVYVGLWGCSQNLQQ